jgi:hypothetical protein
LGRSDRRYVSGVLCDCLYGLDLRVNMNMSVVRVEERIIIEQVVCARCWTCT